MTPTLAVPGADPMEAWRRWIDEQRLPMDRAYPAVVAALEAGAGAEAAGAAARLAGGLRRPADLQLIRSHVAWIDSVIDDLAKLDAPADLVAHYRNRREVLRSMAAAPAAATAAPPTPSPTLPPPSLRQFLAEQSIQVLSYVGAFLLIVATVLFELYAAGDMSGSVRFSAVFALTAIFAVAGWLCLTTERMRLVGQVYVVIFALLTPLTGVAAYVFLGLGRGGVTVDQALAGIGLGSAAIYALLAWTMTSRAYAAMSLLALAIGVSGMADAAVLPGWRPALLAPLVAAYVLVRHLGRRRHVFESVAEPFIHAVALLAALELLTAHDRAGWWPASVTMVLVGAAYALYGWLAQRAAFAAAAAAGTLAALSVSAALGFGQAGAAVVLGVAVVLYALAAETARGGRHLRELLLVGMAVQGVALIALSARPAWLQAALLVVAAATTAVISVRGRRPAWLLLSCAELAMAWYWWAVAILPPPAHAGLDTLLALYSPLPAGFAGVGLALGLTVKKFWAWPLYGAAAVAGLAVALGAAAHQDLTLAGRALLLYAALAYAAGSVERAWYGHLVATLAAAAGILALSSAASVSPPLQVALLGAFFAVVYAAAYAWRTSGRSDIVPAHRALGAAGLALAALACFTDGEFLKAGSTASLVALGLVLLTATVIYVDGRLNALPWLDYVAAIVASLGSYWLNRYLGVTEAQWYVAAPGLTMMASGLFMTLEKRFHHDDWDAAALYAGSGLLMGAAVVESLGGGASAWQYITIGVVEGAIAVMLGIVYGSRALLVAGGAGLGLLALRSVVLLVQQGVALFVVFGSVALLLLVAGAALAMVRGLFRAPAPPGGMDGGGKAT